MHIAAIPNRSARPTFLLRKSARKGKHVTSETLTNLSELSNAQIEAIRRELRVKSLGLAVAISNAPGRSFTAMSTPCGRQWHGSASTS